MKRLLSLLGLLAMTAAAYAQEPAAPATSEPAAVAAQEATLLSPDSKSWGMGGVSMTTVAGSHAIYNNASMSLFSSQPVQLSTSFNRGNNGYDNYAISGYCNINNKNSIQAGWRRYARDAGNAGNNDTAVDLGYSRRVSEGWAVGVVGRYQHLNRPGENKADALMADLSVAYVKTLPWQRYTTLRFGAKWSDIGCYLRNAPYSLPMKVTTGIALDCHLKDSHELTFAGDIGYYMRPTAARGLSVALGAEYNLMQLLQLRAGYHFGEHSSNNPSYASFGAGIRFMHIRVDASYILAPNSPWLHKTYSLSCGLDF